MMEGFFARTFRNFAMTDTLSDPIEAITALATPAIAAQSTDAPFTEPSAGATPALAEKRPARPNVLPTLEKLAGLYPKLFGANFLPLKRGIFQDLLDAHPDVFEREILKAALSFHTRSTRYLGATAAGKPRHDLSGQAVEDMAPEHVYHALIEVFRRRQTRGDAPQAQGKHPKQQRGQPRNRTVEDPRAELIGRIVKACEASGLSPQAYDELVRSRNEEANALLDEAMTEAKARAAKTEAMLQAFQASGKPVDEFADMYGLDPRAVSRMLKQATGATVAPAAAAAANLVAA